MQPAYFVPVAFATLLFGACGSESTSGRACIPGAQITCACPNGQAAAQICNATGSAFGPCACADGTGGASTSSSSTMSTSSTSTSSTTTAASTSSTTSTSASSTGGPMPCSAIVPDGAKDQLTSATFPDVAAWPYVAPYDIEVQTIVFTLPQFGPAWFARAFADNGSGQHPASPAITLATSTTVPASSNVAPISFHMSKGVTYWIGIGCGELPPKAAGVLGDSKTQVPHYVWDGVTWSGIGPSPTGALPGMVITGVCP